VRHRSLSRSLSTMEIELVPDPGSGDPVARAAIVALTRENLAGDDLPRGIASAWRRAGVDEAIDRNPGSTGDAVRRAPRSGSDALG
jgi:hypothetical protein